PAPTSCHQRITQQARGSEAEAKGRGGGGPGADAAGATARGDEAQGGGRPQPGGSPSLLGGGRDGVRERGGERKRNSKPRACKRQGRDDAPRTFFRIWVKCHSPITPARRPAAWGDFGSPRPAAWGHVVVRLLGTTVLFPG